MAKFPHKQGVFLVPADGPGGRHACHSQLEKTNLRVGVRGKARRGRLRNLLGKRAYLPSPRKRQTPGICGTPLVVADRGSLRLTYRRIGPFHLQVKEA